MKTLYDLNEGEDGIILKIKGRGQFRHRIMEMGFIPGKQVIVVKKAPLKDPIEYNIMGYQVSLRNSEANLIEIDKDGKEETNNNSQGVIEETYINESWLKKRKNIHVALVGNPNSGKTTFFNFASGLKEKVGNYAGVTVDAKEAKYRQNGYTFSIVDLPGTYSIKSFSPEEIYVRNYIFNNLPDIVINIIDASNLERNLYLTTQLIDMGIQMVIALNMFDELEKKGDILNYSILGKMIGVPIIPTVSSKGKGIKELFDKIIEIYENRESTIRHIHVNYGISIEGSIKAIQSKIKTEVNESYTNIVSARYLAVSLLENDKEYMRNITHCSNSEEIIQASKIEYSKLEKHFSEPVETVITDLRYGFISGALKETMKVNRVEQKRRADDIDYYLTHKYLGIPIFIVFMWLTFFTTFSLGGYPKHWLEIIVSKISETTSIILPNGILKDFLTEGIIAGVGGVIVFLPNIIILFLFTSLMEDTGYMARAVFIMDKVMHKIGLHGKSFIPLLMGFGCNVPAIMATRIVESRRDRLITMLITPFMSCSARLPVYVLLISAFFTKNQGTILFLLYLTGILIAIVSAQLLKKAFFKTKDIPFVMELPPYRFPTIRSIVKHMWFRTGLYLKRIGTVILFASIVIWVLSYFPRNIDHSGKNKNLSQEQKQFSPKSDYLGINSNGPNNSIVIQQEANLNKVAIEAKGEQQSNSFIGMIGRFMEPVMKPLGFDWKMSISILSGLAAKEVVVSTMGVLYQADNSNKAQNSLIIKLRTQTYASGKKVFTPLVAFCFMLFILIYFPCIGVVSAIKREAASWRWAAFTIVYTTFTAWLCTFIVYQIGNLF